MNTTGALIRSRLGTGILAAVALGSAAAEAPPGPAAASPVRAFCIDFNWGPGGPNGFAPPGLWAGASPEAHVQWYKDLGASVIQTFAVSCNGYAWYQGGTVPPQPGLKHDFLPEVVRLGHAQGLRVMGYFCVGANTRWGQMHPELSYGAPSAPHIPLTREYLDLLCGSVDEALRLSGMDGFMIDWVWNTSGRWLPCEQRLYQELMGEPFPGAETIDAARRLAFDRRAVSRCWQRLRETAKRVRPDCVIWLSCADLRNPTVVDSDLFREVDWLMNEAPDPATLAAVQAMAGPQTRRVQCVVGWGPQHDAARVLADPAYGDLAIYGFAKPEPNSLPLPVAECLSRRLITFTGNDRNIAVLARHWNGRPLRDAPTRVSAAADGTIRLTPATAAADGATPVAMEDQIGHWSNPRDTVSWCFRPRQAGAYEVRLVYACMEGKAGSRLAVRVGERSLEVVSEATGPTWREYATRALGQVRLDAMDTTLILQPYAEPPWQAISVKAVELVPANAPP